MEETDRELLIRIDEKLTNALAVQKHHEEILHGNNGEKGLKTRVIILEKHKESGDKHIFAAWAALCGVAMEFFFGRFLK